MSLYYTMKQMLPVAEGVGNIKEVGMTENWICLKDRVAISGKTIDGRKFELVLEIDTQEEVEKDA